MEKISDVQAKKLRFRKDFLKIMMENQRRYAAEARAESVEEFKKRMREFGKPVR